MNPIILNRYSRKDALIKMFIDRGYKTGAEIGTDRGHYAELLCQKIPNLNLYCIDPWFPYTEGNEVHSQADMNIIYNQAQYRLAPYFHAELIKQTSMQAVHSFGDNTLDFVFIDGNHTYDYVKEDIREWTKKVRPGGIVAGHDYKEDKVNNYGVIEAVNEYVKDNHINPWFILRAGGNLVDCWMFIKS